MFDFNNLVISEVECFCVCLTEVVGQLSAADLLCFLAKLQSVKADFFTGNIGCHDEDGIFTFDGLPLPVCEATLRGKV